MHFVLQIPTLQRVAQVKIVATLLNLPDIFAQITESFDVVPRYYSIEKEKKWKEIEEQVKNKVWALPLPEVYKKELLRYVKPLKNEIVAWGRYHIKAKNIFQYNIFILLRNHLRWTMHGTIDYAKTAELMVKDERVDVETRFIIACINCLEDEARELIPFIPEERRQKYFYCHPLITYFTCILTGQELVEHLPGFFEFMDTPFQDKFLNQHLFMDTLDSGNGAASEYFFEKLRPEEKEEIFVEYQIGEFLHTMPPTCNLMYYLSLINEEQQERMFRDCGYDLLKGLLRWPMQSLFVKAAQCGWSYMSMGACSGVLSAILRKVKDGFEDYDYCQLFRECLHLSPVGYQRYILSNYFDCLIKTKKVELVKLVLNEAPSSSILALCHRNDELRQLLMDERVISDAALTACKKRAVVNSVKYKNDKEKRLRSQHLNRLISMVMAKRNKSREKMYMINLDGI